MLDIVCFSKNSSMQQELFIRTTKEKLHYPHKISVQYFASDGLYAKGYHRAMEKHTDVGFIKERGFKSTLIKLLDSLKSDYIMFEVGDSVWINDTSHEDIDNILLSLKLDESFHCASLRLHSKATYCFPARKKMRIPHYLKYNSIDGYMTWDWTKCDSFTGWGYPMSVVAHIYRKSDIIPLIKKGIFNNVNQLEDMLNHNRMHDKHEMVGLVQPKMFNIQNTFTKETINDYEKDKYSAKDLNNRFLNGEVISTEGIYGLESKSCHGEVEYKFEIKL